MPERLTIRMPALSATMESGELVRWTVSVGDTVAEGQAIAEVITDKVDMELESPYAGTVDELVAEPGSDVAVGQPVALLSSDSSSDLLGGLGLDDDDPQVAGEAPPETDKQPEANVEVPATVPEPAPAPQRPPGPVPAAPPARRRARELGVDLAEVEATGRRGQVTSDDLERYLAARDAGVAAEPEPVRAAEPEPPRSAPDRRSSLRAATAKLMIASAGVPQFVLHRRVDLSRAAERKAGRSWTTEIARALDAALRDAPELCARWDDGRGAVVALGEPRLGLAVESDDGLVVVGVDPLDELTPEQADHHVRDTVRRARQGRLTAADRSGLTCTLSNLGGYGVDLFEALVMPPQAAIMSVGRVAELPAVIDGRVRPLRGVNLGLTVDHRVADGVQGARLLAGVARRLES